MMDFFEDSSLLLIAGPCQLESREHALYMAERIIESVQDLPVKLLFKSSFDKANRTSLNSPRGIGMEEGLRIFEEVKSKLGIPVITDIHEPSQAGQVAEVVDVLQIPAFLCRQTDLLVSAGRTGKPVNIKKGQFMSPQSMAFSAEKVRAGGSSDVWLCERGTFFGYGDLVVDMRGLRIMKELGYRVIFDMTHSAQSPAGKGDHSGGNRYDGIFLSRCAAGGGIDGLFVECHDNPRNAPSDGDIMLDVKDLRQVVRDVCTIRSAVRHC